MPVTPLHFGPGAAFKAVGGRQFSLVVFGLAPVVMDLEAVVRFASGAHLLHGPVHSIVGATLVGLGVLAVGKPVGEELLRLWNWRLSPAQTKWLCVEPRLTWLASASGAFVGTYSHVLLDSVIHFDVHPLFPFGQKYHLAEVISIKDLRMLCVGLGLLGLLALVALRLRERKGSKSNNGPERMPSK